MSTNILTVITFLHFVLSKKKKRNHDNTNVDYRNHDIYMFCTFLIINQSPFLTQSRVIIKNKGCNGNTQRQKITY